MIFSIVILILVLAIAFFHYLQGLLSATLSAIIAIIAAALAVSYHETVVSMLLRGKFADQATAIALVVLFAAIYLLLRVAFDGMVPGNVRLPAVVDKVGGAVMGLIAGIFAMGIVAMAGQSLPFTPSIAGYARYETVDERGAVVSSGTRGTQSRDVLVFDEMVSETFDPAYEQGLLLPVDDILLGMVSHLSDGGSLAGTEPLTTAHPNFLQELFGNRLGIQVGAKHTAQEIGEVAGIYTAPSFPQAQAENSSVQVMEQLQPVLKPTDDEMILVVRTIFHYNTTDKDKLFRFSPGSIRLVANGANYFPVGTLDNAIGLKANRIDDFLIVDMTDTSDRGADLVFVVKKEDVLADGGEKSIADGVFLEVKRLSRQDLSGKVISTDLKPDERVSVLRKGPPAPRVRPSKKPADNSMPPGTPGAPHAPGAADPAGIPMDANGMPSAR
jgi:hypothetical protein